MIDIRNPPTLTQLLTAGMAQSSPSRSLNTDFVPSATKWTFVEYNVRIIGSSTISIAGSTSVAGRIELRKAVGSPSSGDVICQTREAVSLSGAVVVGVDITAINPVDAVLSAYVAPGETVNLTTVNEYGAPTYSVVRSIEWTLG